MRRPLPFGIAIALVMVVGLFAIDKAKLLLMRSDPTHSFGCRLLGCAKIQALDRACSLFAEAELIEPGAAAALKKVRAEWPAVGELDPSLLDRWIAPPPPARYAVVLHDARDFGGGESWSCPAIERVLTSTAIRTAPPAS
jgi:hypothetical protein